MSQGQGGPGSQAKEVEKDVYWSVCGQDWAEEPSGLAGPFERGVVREAVTLTGQGGFVRLYCVSTAEPGATSPESPSLWGSGSECPKEDFVWIWKVAVKQQPFLMEGGHGHLW